MLPSSKLAILSTAPIAPNHQQLTQHNNAANDEEVEPDHVEIELVGRIHHPDSLVEEGFSVGSVDQRGSNQSIDNNTHHMVVIYNQ